MARSPSLRNRSERASSHDSQDEWDGVASGAGRGGGLFGAEPADHDPLLTGCRDALLAQFAKLESALPEMTRSADAAAERLLGGGRLFAAGQTGFVEEASLRAGGLMMLSPLAAKTALSEKDVLLVGALTNADDAAEKACRRGKEAGAYVVLFSPAFEEPKPPIAALCDAHVVNFAPCGRRRHARRRGAARGCRLVALQRAGALDLDRRTDRLAHAQREDAGRLAEHHARGQPGAQCEVLCGRGHVEAALSRGPLRAGSAGRADRPAVPRRAAAAGQRAPRAGAQADGRRGRADGRLRARRRRGARGGRGALHRVRY